MEKNTNNELPSNFLDRLIDEDGIKTEVVIKITNQTLLKTSLFLVATAFFSALVIQLSTNALQNT